MRTSRFYIRNDTAAGAQAQVDILTTMVNDLLDTGDLSIEVRIADQPWYSTTVGDTTQPASTRISSGGSLPVDVRVRFEAASTSRSMALPLDLAIRVTLAEPVAPTDPPDEAATTPSSTTHASRPPADTGPAEHTYWPPADVLGASGSPLRLSLLVVSVVAVAAGLGLVL
ncbi:MAG: hypothetical protein ACK5KO_06710, partial [Arachnia sp.]